MLKNLEYCPQCGNKTLAFVEEKKLYCNNCEFTLYQNIAGAVAVLLRYEDHLLFTRRNKKPHKGMLDLPGGFVDADESAETTCRREIKEELDFELDECKLEYKGSFPNDYEYKSVLYHTIDLFFEYELDKKEEFVLEEEELQEVVWIAISELNFDELAFESQKKFLKDYLSDKS